MCLHIVKPIKWNVRYSQNSSWCPTIALSWFNLDKIMKWILCLSVCFLSNIKRGSKTSFPFVVFYFQLTPFLLVQVVLCFQQCNRLNNIMWFTLLDKNHTHKSSQDNPSWAQAAPGCVGPPLKVLLFKGSGLPGMHLRFFKACFSLWGSILTLHFVSSSKILIWSTVRKNENVYHNS